MKQSRFHARWLRVFCTVTGVSISMLAGTQARAASFELIYNGVFNTQDALNPASQSTPSFFTSDTPFTIRAWFDTSSPNLAPPSPPAPPPFAGFRAYSREALLAMPLLANSDDFVFDNQLIAQAVALGLRIGEISCPTSYHGDASSINFSRSVRYGLGVLATSAAFVAWRLHLARPRIFANRQEDRISSRLAATT